MGTEAEERTRQDFALREPNGLILGDFIHVLDKLLVKGN